MSLRRKPLSIKFGIRTGIPIRRLCDLIRHSETPFANDVRGVTITFIGARCADVVIMRGINTSIPFQIAVIIIGHVSQVVEILVRITRPPGFIHCLDMEVVFRIDGKLLLSGTDALYIHPLVHNHPSTTKKDLLTSTAFG